MPVVKLRQDAIRGLSYLGRHENISASIGTRRCPASGSVYIRVGGGDTYVRTGYIAASAWRCSGAPTS